MLMPCRSDPDGSDDPPGPRGPENDEQVIRVSDDDWSDDDADDHYQPLTDQDADTGLFSDDEDENNNENRDNIAVEDSGSSQGPSTPPELNSKMSPGPSTKDLDRQIEQVLACPEFLPGGGGFPDAPNPLPLASNPSPESEITRSTHIPLPLEDVTFIKEKMGQLALPPPPWAGEVGEDDWKDVLRRHLANDK